MNAKSPARMMAPLCILLAACVPAARAASRPPAGLAAAVPRGPDHPGLTGDVRVTLPVHRIPTTLGVDYGLSSPRSVTLSIPAAWQGDVAAYWSGTVVLAPAGWTGKGLFGADGSGEVDLYPPGGSDRSGARISLRSDGGCVGCGALSAARYFPYIRRHWSRFEVPPIRPPAQVKVLSEVYLAPDLIAYRMPGAASLEADGVAYSSLIRAGSGATFMSMDVFLPPRDHGLATLVLNYFDERVLGSLP